MSGNIQKHKSSIVCQKSLLTLQSSIPDRDNQELHWRNEFYGAVRRAVCSHDWVKLQTFLAEYPPNSKSGHFSHVFMLDAYLRALLFLLMYHPTAKAQNTLHQFMHMVLGLRSEEEKKAFTKLLLTLPDKCVTRCHVSKM